MLQDTGQRGMAVPVVTVEGKVWPWLLVRAKP